MKIQTKRDTTGIMKKIKWLSGLRINGSYNFAKDSIRLSDITFSSGSTEIYKGIRINFSGSMTPNYIDPETNTTLDRWLVKETGRLLRLKSFRMNLTTSFQSRNKTGNKGGFDKAGLRNPANFGKLILERMSRIASAPVLAMNLFGSSSSNIWFSFGSDSMTSSIGCRRDRAQFSENFHFPLSYLVCQIGCNTAAIAYYPCRQRVLLCS